MGLETIDFRRFQLQPGDRVLDVGCGEGRHTLSAYLQADVHAIGVDLSTRDLGTAQRRYTELDQSDPHKRVDLIRGSAFSLPFADHSFDKVICSEVLEHLPSYEDALLELKRVLKPGGLLAVSVPRFGPEWLCWKLSDAYHQVEGGHIRIFERKALESEIETLGLVCYDRHWAHGLHSPYWWLKCLFWNSADNNPLVKAYHKLLVWDLMSAPKSTRLLEQMLNPLIGKSVVMYFVRGTE